VYVLPLFTVSNTTINTLRYKGTTLKPVYAICYFNAGKTGAAWG
jgi:hypothetical protein